MYIDKPMQLETSSMIFVSVRWQGEMGQVSVCVCVCVCMCVCEREEGVLVRVKVRVRVRVRGCKRECVCVSG